MTQRHEIDPQALLLRRARLQLRLAPIEIPRATVVRLAWGWLAGCLLVAGALAGALILASAARQ